MYTRILIPLDGSQMSETVIPYVHLLAKLIGCPVDLLRVIEAVPSELADAHGLRLYQLADGIRDAARDLLSHISTTLQESGLEVRSTVRDGDPASVIVNEAEGVPGTLIAISTHGRSGVSRWVLGSVADKVLHTTTDPLLIIRSQHPEGPVLEVNLKSVIVPLDGSQLAEQALPHAIWLAKSLGLAVDLLRETPSASLPEYSRYTPAVYYPPYEEYLERANAEARDYLQGLNEGIQRQGILSVGQHLSRGHPAGAAGAILDRTRDTPDSLVVMTTHGRSGIGRWVLGSVADRVVKHSGGPVLLIRDTETTSESSRR